MTTTHPPNQYLTDLHRRARELRAVCETLAPDIEDPAVMSEYTVMRRQLAITERDLTSAEASR